MCDVWPGDDAGKMRINVGMMMQRVRDRGLRDAHREPEQNHHSVALCGAASNHRHARRTSCLNSFASSCTSAMLSALAAMLDTCVVTCDCVVGTVGRWASASFCRQAVHGIFELREEIDTVRNQHQEDSGR